MVRVRVGCVRKRLAARGEVAQPSYPVERHLVRVRVRVRARLRLRLRLRLS